MRVEALDLNGPCEKRAFRGGRPVIDRLQVLGVIRERPRARSRQRAEQKRCPRIPRSTLAPQLSQTTA
jgi:hypothetical protein